MDRLRQASAQAVKETNDRIAQLERFCLDYEAVISRLEKLSQSRERRPPIEAPICSFATLPSASVRHPAEATILLGADYFLSTTSVHACEILRRRVGRLRDDITALEKQRRLMAQRGLPLSSLGAGEMMVETKKKEDEGSEVVTTGAIEEFLTEEQYVEMKKIHSIWLKMECENVRKKQASSDNGEEAYDSDDVSPETAEREAKLLELMAEEERSNELADDHLLVTYARTRDELARANRNDNSAAEAFPRDVEDVKALAELLGGSRVASDATDEKQQKPLKSCLKTNSVEPSELKKEGQKVANELEKPQIAVVGEINERPCSKSSTSKVPSNVSNRQSLFKQKRQAAKNKPP